MAKWKIGKGEKKNLFRLIEMHQFICEEIFYLPIFFYSLENVKETHHLNIYIFSCFFPVEVIHWIHRKSHRKNLKNASFKN